VYLVAGFGPSGLEQLFVVPFRNNIFGGTTGPLDEAAFRAFEKVFRERSTADTSRYYSDPRSLGALKGSLRRLRLSDLRQLRPRQFLFAARIVWRNYPFAAAGVGLLALVPMAIVMVRRRRLRQRRDFEESNRRVPAPPPEKK
jgi:hypothetical protein